MPSTTICSPKPSGIDHLRAGNTTLAVLLDRGAVLAHPWVTGELALCRLRQREEVLGLLNGLPRAEVATAAELLSLIDRQKLSGMGVGYVDAQLLGATMLTPSATLWTNDRRLAAAASRLGNAFDPPELAA